MSVEETRKIMEAYFNDDYSVVAEGAHHHDIPRDKRMPTRDFLRHWYEEAFPDSSADVLNTVLGESGAVGEYLFKGTNSGGFYDAEPTNKRMELRVAAVYDVSAGQIQECRVYYDSASMDRQLGSS
jgi:predicted ester cyclase